MTDETVFHDKSGRQWIIDLIRDQFDPAPSHYKLGDNWDDGAPAIADAIFAQLPLLMAERGKEQAQQPLTKEQAEDLTRRST